MRKKYEIDLDKKTSDKTRTHNAAKALIDSMPADAFGKAPEGVDDIDSTQKQLCLDDVDDSGEGEAPETTADEGTDDKADEGTDDKADEGDAEAPADDAEARADDDAEGEGASE